MHETLINDGCLFRALVETHFSEASSHPDYLPFDPENPAKGQCGVATKKFGDYMLQLTTRARVASSIQESIRQGEYQDTSVPYLFADDNPQLQRLRKFTRGLEMTMFWYAYGDVREEGTDKLILDDHCWLWSVDIDSGEGYDNDITADQLSTPELHVPPVMVQATGKSDGQRVYHVARELELIEFGPRARGDDAYNRRLGKMAGGMVPELMRGRPQANGMVPLWTYDRSEVVSTAWETASENSHIAERVKQLKKQCFPDAA